MKKLMTQLLFLLLLLPASQISVADTFQEGVQYKRILPPQHTANEDKVEVVELFWYGCPHCHRFQPYVERWLRKKPGNVDYIRLPATLRESWAIHARAFYAAEALGALDKTHADLFDAIHNKKRKLNTEDALVKFYVEHGVDEDAFRKAFHSFGVDSKVRRARQMTRRYHVEGTPAVIVNGKYRIDAGMAGGYPGMIKVIDYLVKLESKTE